MDEEKRIIRLPARVTIRDVSPLYERIEAAKDMEGIVLDFAGVENIEYSGVVFLNWLRRKYPGLGFVNLKPETERLIGNRSGRTELPVKNRDELSSRRFVERRADQVIGFRNELKRYLLFLADGIFYMGQYFKARRGVYPGEVIHQMHFMGYRSFPLVCMISFLVGTTISLTSAAQLRLFGADMLLADFVGIAMITELVPLMTAIILVGKVGASITAEISTMAVMEEIDAVRTMGVVPAKFLMVPRMIAVTIAVPLLIVIADFVGIFAGMLVARFTFKISPGAFLEEMLTAVFLRDFLIQMLKAMVFGWVVVISSGFKGFSVQRGAEEVGRATTESVVLSITMIIIIDCIFAFLFYY